MQLAISSKTSPKVEHKLTSLKTARACLPCLGCAPDPPPSSPKLRSVAEEKTRLLRQSQDQADPVLGGGGALHGEELCRLRAVAFGRHAFG